MRGAGFSGAAGCLWLRRAGEAEIHFTEGQHAGGDQPLDARERFFGAGLRRRDLDAPRGDDDQPAGGGFGRAQQAQDHPPDPARHFIRTALVEPGIDEQHRDDAQKRRAVALDSLVPPVLCVIAHAGKDGGGGGAVDKFCGREG
jgi:hypothetical protein